MNNYQDDLIGMFLTKPELLDITILKPQFFDKKHRIIFNAVRKSYHENKIFKLQQTPILSCKLDSPTLLLKLEFLLQLPKNN